MRNVNASLFLLTFVFASPLLAAFELPSQEAALTENAATSYLQAFNLLPTLNANEQRTVKNFRSAPLDAVAASVIEKSQPTLQMLLRGAKCRQCDWGINKEDGIEAMMPYMSKARQVVILALLRARYYIQQDRQQEAVDDFVAALTLGRQVGSAGPLISYLVQVAIEAMVVETAADNLTNLEPPSLKLLLEQFENMPAGASLRTAFLGEKELLLASDSRSLPQYQHAIRLWDELAKIADLPPEEFEEKVKDISNPALGALGPGVQRASYLPAASQAKTAMLLAAIVRLLDGEEGFLSIKDPYGDGPFAYKQLKKGFQLASKLKVKNKPVTLKIGAGR